MPSINISETGRPFVLRIDLQGQVLSAIQHAEEGTRFAFRCGVVDRSGSTFRLRWSWDTKIVMRSVFYFDQGLVRYRASPSEQEHGEGYYQTSEASAGCPRAILGRLLGPRTRYWLVQGCILDPM